MAGDVRDDGSLARAVMQRVVDQDEVERSPELELVHVALREGRLHRPARGPRHRHLDARGGEVDPRRPVPRLGEEHRGPALPAAAVQDLGAGLGAECFERVADRRPLQEGLDPPRRTEGLAEQMRFTAVERPARRGDLGALVGLELLGGGAWFGGAAAALAASGPPRDARPVHCPRTVAQPFAAPAPGAAGT